MVGVYFADYFAETGVVSKWIIYEETCNTKLRFLESVTGGFPSKQIYAQSQQ